MTNVEKNLFGEMIRTIRLLGAKEDILGSLDSIKMNYLHGEGMEKILIKLKCWNDYVEEFMEGDIPPNGVYLNPDMVDYSCESDKLNNKQF